LPGGWVAESFTTIIDDFIGEVSPEAQDLSQHEQPWNHEAKPSTDRRKEQSRKIRGTNVKFG
jgi:hypothetical protein